MSLSSRVRPALSEWINHLLDAVPIRSRATFCELLCACLISPEGWVTRAISALQRRSHWTTYYKLIERNQVSVLALARALLTLILKVLPQTVITLVIDDTLVMRKSPGAPGCAIRHEHSRKANRPTFVTAQCWVTLGVSVCDLGGTACVLPVLSRLVPAVGNRNKLVMALAILQSLHPALGQQVRVLFDCWFMRARLVLPLLAQGCRVIGQARIDTALFLPPVPPQKPRRGRKRVYGERLTVEMIDTLPVIECELRIYGKTQRVRLRSTVALARFLKATPVRAVWCQFFNPDQGAWSRPRLLLASEIGLQAGEIVQLYARRWGIEPLFHNLKRWWGADNLWQQSVPALELWMHLRSMAWVLAQLLTLVVRDSFPIGQIAPWRSGHTLTAGLIAQWLRLEFSGLPFRDGYDSKSRKFSFPEARFDRRTAEAAGQSP